MTRTPARSLLLLVLLLSAGAATAGTLEIVTQPEVEVYWEGVLLATTDGDGLLVVEDVPAGPFGLTLRKEGFEELSTRVTIGEGATRLRRRLVAISAAEPSTAPAPEAAAEAVQPSSGPSPPVAELEEPTSGGPAPAAPAVRISRGAWLAGIAALGLAAGVATWSRRRTEPSPPAGQTREKPMPRVTRAPAEPQAEGGFLSELRQRERALDELVDVSSADGRRAEIPEPDVVDVAWKEID